MDVFRIIITAAFILLIAAEVGEAKAQSSNCDVEKILEARNAPEGTLAVDGYGSTTEVSTLLVPTSLEKGRYEVSVSRKSDNLYLVEGQSLYLRTSMCLEMATMSDAILEVASSDYGFGTLYFLK